MAFRTPKPRTSSIPPLPNTSLAAPSTLPRSPVTSSKLAAAGAREESERLWNRTRVLEAELAVSLTQKDGTNQHRKQKFACRQC